MSETFKQDSYDFFFFVILVREEAHRLIVKSHPHQFYVLICEILPVLFLHTVKHAWL